MQEKTKQEKTKLSSLEMWNKLMSVLSGTKWDKDLWEKTLKEGGWTPEEWRNRFYCE